ncbi:hypothetical protein PAPHI01_1220 [Pancytospora philotis]|nr:hypothetical protein PAPHI01_1220 [Pancytospora philotis]
MKIDASEYPVERAVILAGEEGCVHNAPLSSLEDVWNRLALESAARVETEHKDAVQENNFYKELACARVENETALETYRLVAQGIVAEYPAQSYKPKPACIKQFTLAEVRRIIKTRRDELMASMRDEQKVYEQAKSIKYNVKLVNGELRVYFDHEKYTSLTKAGAGSDRKPKGLSCTIVYRGIRLEGYAACAPLSGYEEAEELHREESLLQTFRRGETAIEIAQSVSENRNPLCLFVLAELKGGKPLARLFAEIIVRMSAFFLSSFLRGCEEIRYVNAPGALLSDGRPAVFFAVPYEKCVYKVVRGPLGFNIYLNGHQISFKSWK